MIADLEDLEKMDASEIYRRRINAKDVLITQKRGELIFPVADGTAKLSAIDYEFREPTRRREGAKISVENIQANRETINLQNQQMTLKPVSTSGRFKVTSSIVITFNSLCRRKKTFPIPLKYIDVTRSTHNDLDVMQEKRIDDYWNVDSNRNLSDS